MNAVLRLRQELDRQGLSTRRFQKMMAETGAPGASYGSIYSYFKTEDAVEPSLSFFEKAADLLGVRRAWLVFGEGARTDEEEKARVHGISDWKRSLVESIKGFDILPPVVQAVFFEAWDRYIRTVGGSPGFTEDQLREMAKTLHFVCTFPMGLPGFRHTLRDEELTDYLLLMLPALMHVMVGFREGESLEAHVRFVERRDGLLTNIKHAMQGPKKPKRTAGR